MVQLSVFTIKKGVKKIRLTETNKEESEKHMAKLMIGRHPLSYKYSAKKGYTLAYELKNITTENN